MKSKIISSSVLEVLRLAFKEFPWLTVIYLTLAIINSLFPTVILAMVTSYFIDSVLSMAGSGSFSQGILLPLFLLLSTMVCMRILEEVPKFFEIRLKAAIELSILPLIVQQQVNLEYQWLEDKSKQELFSLLVEDIVEVFLEGIQAYAAILQGIVAVISVFFLLTNLLWWSGILIFLCSIPLFSLSFYLGKKNYAAKVDAKKYERRYSYYSDQVLVGKEALEERMLFGYVDDMTGRYEQDFQKASSIQLLVLLKTRLATRGMQIVLILLTILTSICLLYPLRDGEISPGNFIGILTVLFNLAEILGGDLQDSSKSLAECGEYMADFRLLMALETTPGAMDLPDQMPIDLEQIEFKGVSFSYPGTDRYVLQNLSFVLEKGKDYALVGPNGSGKSTIVKLLTGLYREYEGEILINGKELRTYPLSAIKALISTVFQDFSHYQVPLKDNLQLGMTREVEEKDYLKALQQSGLTELYDSLPLGLDTALGKLQTGARELSGGQWQKITFARSLLHAAPIKILDEPTAALDPIAEDSLYQEFGRLMQDKTTLFISHRLGSTKLADQIIVLDGGRIVEQGMFESLLNLDGFFSEMYSLQKEWYQ
ncbi:ABC transporter ATP-binding protein [Streptococcus danieliae]|uniref:ABC transporter ATP-binding protein n=1 Tax=Streptococcus danieliae TaxID=747656 RepID=A0A7Z0M7G6_9STRE|nr:ABC transporter ATP-binding protein [Streptococcus danieliae]MBF0700052.1 ABC transporter ATP-binding protein [Streptococcus danieliae]NYS97228.1 ABC transporter ATP-binding protein [Streptococcus danieliae]